MDARGLRIAGPSIPAHNRLGGYALAAMEDLGYRSAGLTITIQPDPWRRPRVEACTFTGGISVVPELLADTARLIWVLSEEVAHAYLGEFFGVPHGGDFVDRFAQESFASWFSVSACSARSCSARRT